MGLDATIFVNREELDAYKCTNAWYKIIDTKKTPTITVGYTYGEGYGDYILYVYIRNIATATTSLFMYNKPGQNKRIRQTISLQKYGSGKLELCICLRGDCYSHLGPFFKTAPARWYECTTEAQLIRKDHNAYLKSMQKPSDIMDFGRAFIAIKNGSLTFETPTIDKKLFSQKELNKITKLFIEWTKMGYYTRVNSPPTVEFIHEFIKYCQNLD
jgi:hypothetical protein